MTKAFIADTKIVENLGWVVLFCFSSAVSMCVLRICLSIVLVNS